MPDSTARARLRKIVEHTDTPAGHGFDIAIQVLILFSLVTFSLETLPDLGPGARHILGWLEWITVMIFTAEYLLRVYVASSRPGYLFSFFGIVDLAAILPFYLVGMDFRAVRLFRVLKLMRYSRATPLFYRAFRIVKHELVLFLMCSAILFYLAGVGIYYFENAAQPKEFASVFHSLWWAVITLTTVGYGDVVPITAGGRCFTLVVLILGIGVVSVPTGLIASALSKARESE